MRREATIPEAVKKARERSYLVTIEAYCEGPHCPTRQVRITTKDHDNELLALIRERGLRCPVCGAALNTHGAHTLSEREAKERADARCSVNVQLYERDHDAGHPIVAVPLSVFLDDTLPSRSVQ